MTTPALSRRRTLSESAAVAGVFLAGTVVLTWPWAAHLGSRIFGDPGDNYEFLWKLWWVPHRIGLGRTPFFAHNVFSQSGGYDLGSTDMSPTATFLFAPVTAVWGPVVAYNLVMLLSFVLAGLGTYLLCRRLGAGRPAAVVGGAAFAFCAFHVVQNYGHLNVAQIGYTPWVFLAADNLAARRRLRDGVWFGVAVALAGLTTWYRLVFLLLTAPVFLLVRMRQTGAGAREVAGPLAMAGVVGAVLTLPFLIPAITFAAKGETPSFGEAAFYSLSVEDYLMPPPGHAVTDYWTDEALAGDNHERIVYPGLVVLALALPCVAFPGLRRQGRSVALVCAVAAVLSFGPVLRWFGEPVVVDVGRTRPAVLHQVATEADPNAAPTELAVPMPVYPIARYAPGLRGLRVWARAAEITTLALSVMAALTLSRLLGTLPRPAHVVVALVALVVVVVDARMTPHVLVEPRARPVDRWLARQPGNLRIAELPWDRGVSGAQLYYSSFHGKEITLSQASVLPKAVTESAAALQAFPRGEDWIGVLQRWRVDYVLVDGSATPLAGIESALASKDVRKVTTQGTVGVFSVPRPR